MTGATLRELAGWAHADIDAPFSCGDDTPPPGDVDEPLDLDPDGLETLAGWFTLGTRVLDLVLSTAGTSAGHSGGPPGGPPAGSGSDPAAGSVGGSADVPSTVQLWPEHFDLAADVAVGVGGRANLGFSPGDGFSEEPYAYVGPWGTERPGHAPYWNAPFGAALVASSVAPSPDPVPVWADFLTRGLDYLAG
jgi:hypothetical protein